MPPKIEAEKLPEGWVNDAHLAKQYGHEIKLASAQTYKYWREAISYSAKRRMNALVAGGMNGTDASLEISQHWAKGYIEPFGQGRLAQHMMASPECVADVLKTKNITPQDAKDKPAQDAPDISKWPNATEFSLDPNHPGDASKWARKFEELHQELGNEYATQVIRRSKQIWVVSPKGTEILESRIPESSRRLSNGAFSRPSCAAR